MENIFTKISIFVLASAVFVGPWAMNNDDWSMLYGLCDKWKIDYKNTGIDRAMAQAIAFEIGCDNYFAYHGSDRGALDTGMKILQRQI